MYGIIGYSFLPSGRTPSRTAAMICSSVQLPMPVPLSGVMFGERHVPNFSTISRPPAPTFGHVRPLRAHRRVADQAAARLREICAALDQLRIRTGRHRLRPLDLAQPYGVGRPRVAAASALPFFFSHPGPTLYPGRADSHSDVMVLHDHEGRSNHGVGKPADCTRGALEVRAREARRPKKMKARSCEWALKTPAASYSPTGLRLQYHRPWRA